MNVNRPIPLLLLILLAVCPLSYGCGPRADLEADFGMQTYDLGETVEAVPLPDCVNTQYGCLPLESVYIAGVVDCELGRLSDEGAALEAQAIAARTYLIRHLSRVGPDATVKTNATFQCWKEATKQRSVQAAVATAGVVMMIDEETIINANYVSGTPRLAIDCSPRSPEESKISGYESWQEVRQAYLDDRRARRKRRFKGIAWTQAVVTHNEGLSGDQVKGTPMARKAPFNRGAMSQYMAVCLAERLGYETMDILRYFYGDDIKLSRRLAGPLEAP